ncbi:MAG: DUF2298 domain-containing protein [Candidatus Promineifilaceae bacterium]
MSEKNHIDAGHPGLLDQEGAEPEVNNGTRIHANWERLALVPLLLILLLGAYFRFTGLNWDDTYHLHPDERFLTAVAAQLHSTDPVTYLKTSESSLNPYNVGQTFYVYGNFPMTVTRLAAELSDHVCLNYLPSCSQNFTFYDGIHLVGRFLSALLDLVSILFIFLIGRRLYDWRVGILGALLLSMAVLPIQQSHFFTMDNWAAALTTITVYAAVRASQDATSLRWWVMAGLTLGLTVASRINVAPLAIVVPIAAVVYLGRREAANDRNLGWRYVLTKSGSADLQWTIVGVILAAFVAAVVFRVAQPYAFADSQIVRETALAETGQPPGSVELLVRSIVGLNPQWKANMAEIRNLQSPDASFPPALQWTNREPILFPLSNFVLWGVGIAAGLTSLLGFAWALWRIVRARPDWTSHLMIVSWTGFYFIFMGLRWVKSIRYFLPVYPFLLLLAGWALVELWQRAGNVAWKRISVATLATLVLASTGLWANAFLDIYRQPVTRVEASGWILDHVPSGATLIYESNGKPQERQLPLRGYAFYEDSPPLFLDFTLPRDAILKAVRFNYLSSPVAEGSDATIGSIQLSLIDHQQSDPLATASPNLLLSEQPQSVTVALPPIPVVADKLYTVVVESGTGAPIVAETSVISSEHWDDPLPVRYEGIDPYSSYYDGLEEGPMPITIPDSDEKRQSFYRWLDESDYIALSSQRALWSLPRLPMTYPLTMQYYEALFGGELGFELVEQFHANLHIGPLYISDTGGQLSWATPPDVGWPPPGDLAAEEAFSVYDHPPVWIFAKTDSYDPQKVRDVLGAVDLSQVIFMTPGQASKAPSGLMLTGSEFDTQQAGGTFDRLFSVDGPLSRYPLLAAVVWWLAVMLAGWIAFPLTFTVFRGLPDRGYAISRILGILVLSYLLWLAASWGLLPNTRGTLALAVLLVVILAGSLLFLQRQRISHYLRNNLTYVLFIELFAFALFLLFILVRLGNPDLWDVIWGGEKPMDVSYFTAVLKSTTFPPYDPWFAGGYLNYYYYGFVYVGVLAKLLGIVPNVAYNLILPMLFSFTGLGAFGLAYNLVAKRQIRNRRNRNAYESATGTPLPAKAVTAGLVAAMLCILLGNLAEVPVMINAWYRTSDSTIDTGVAPLDALVRTIDGGIDLAFTDRSAPIYPGDWFWSASRAIEVPDGEVQPITEFPFFTFLYGDLHAHMIALPLTLLALSWAVSFALEDDEEERNYLGRFGAAASWIVGGLTIGVLRATNTWDYPTYLLLGALAVTYRAYQRRKCLDLRMLGQAALGTAALIALTVLLFLPFTENYGVAYGSFSLWPGSYTQMRDYLVIYGLFLIFILTYLAVEFRSWTSSWTQAALTSWKPLAIPIFASLGFYVLLLFWLLYKGFWILPVALTLCLIAGGLALRPRLEPERRVTLILISAAVALTALVEVIVLDGDIGRMNTVFKFYMQVWVMLSVASGVAAVWSWPSIKARPRFRRIWQVVLAILLGAAALYPLLATKAKWDIRMSDQAPNTLDGMAFMKTTSYGDTRYDGSSQVIDLSYDYEALQWMRRNIEGSPVIVEAHGSNPYRSIANRVAMYTGLPAVVGWDWHQRQQRAVLPGSIVSERIEDVNTFYNTTDLSVASAILDKYGVGYVYSGPLEHTYYLPEGIDKFDQMVNSGQLREVYRNQAVTIYEVLI